MDNETFQNSENQNNQPNQWEQMANEAPAFNQLSEEDRPEGVRDEQDYQEYLAEKQARENERQKAEQEAEAERLEQLDTFEKRVELNKSFYNELAKEKAFILALNPDVQHMGLRFIPGESIYTSRESGRYPANYTEEQRAELNKQRLTATAYINADYMMSVLDDGVVNEEYEDGTTGLEVYECKFLAGGQRLSMAKQQISTFEEAARAYASDTGEKFGYGGRNSEKLSQIYSQEEIDHAKEKAAEMMDVSRYESSIDDLLRKQDEYIHSWDIDKAETAIKLLDQRSGESMFHFNEAGHYSHLAYDERAVIPDMESRYRLEDKILQVKEKVARVIERVKQEEYAAAATKSPRGRAVIRRAKS